MPSVDVNSEDLLGELESRIMAGPITLVLIYADWCGHCQRFKPMMEELENNANRTIQTARVRDDMFPKSSLAKTPIEGYPSVILVNKNKEVIPFKNEDGSVQTTIPDYKNEKLMNSIVENGGKTAVVNLLNSTATKKNGVVPETLNVNATTMNTNVESQELKNLMNNNVKLSGPPNPNVDRVTLERQEAILEAVTPNKSQKRVPSTEGQTQQLGGGLFELLTEAAYSTGPAVGLLALASYMSKRRRSTKKARKGRGRK